MHARYGAIETNTIILKNDTNKVLQTLQIMGVRYPNFFVGSKFNFIDSNLLQFNKQNSLAELLSNNSQLFIKSYGPGMLASPSLRGGNANHTAVLWNGINLQNPMNGQVDFSTIPSFLLDNVALQYGSASSLFGSGTIGGAVHLQSNLGPKEGFEAEFMTGIGSYGSFTGGLKLGLKTKNNFSQQQKLFWQSSDNNFWFRPIDLLQPQVSSIDPKTVAKQRASNAQFGNFAWIQEYLYEANRHQKLGFKIWLQQSMKNIVPALFSPNTGAHQVDKTAKIIADYQYKKEAYETLIRYSFLKDIIEYTDLNTPRSIANSNSHQVTFDQFIYKTKFQVQLSLLGQHIRANLNTNTSNWEQNKVAIFGTLKTFHFHNRIQQQFSLRQEWCSLQTIPIMPSYGIHANLNKSWTVFANVSRSFRLPTFNDLYWPNMGNPNLKPEQGWNTELSLSYGLNKAAVQGKSTLTAFSKQVHNWIIWVPNGGNLSTPKNIYLVWSRGLEYEWLVKFKLGKVAIGSNGFHSLTLASNEQSTLSNDASLHQQIIYTPRVKHTLQASIQYKATRFLYTYNYVGTRFLSADHSNWLNPFNYSGIALSQEIQLKKQSFNLQASINNLFNQTYQVMVNRPMPLLNYQLTLTIKL